MDAIGGSGISFGSILVVVLLILAVAGAVTRIIKRKQSGYSITCSEDCSSCNQCDNKK